jgi:hypothetical protein
VTKYLTQLDEVVLEVHFAREQAVFERFTVTQAGWHEVWLLTKYNGAYANDSKCLVKGEAIAWSRRVNVQRWFDIDHENLIPSGPSDRHFANLVAVHKNHEMGVRLDPDEDDSCGVSSRFIEGYGTVYRVEE